MTKKDESGIGDSEDDFSSVPHANGLRLLLAIDTQHNMHTDHVDISQSFTVPPEEDSLRYSES